MLSLPTTRIVNATRTSLAALHLQSLYLFPSASPATGQHPWHTHQCLSRGMTSCVPAEHGSADISLTFTAALSADECEAIRLDRAEYEEACWIDPFKIIPDTSYHTAVRRWGPIAEGSTFMSSVKTDLWSSAQSFGTAKL